MSIYETLGRYYDALVRDDEASDRWVEWIESWNPGPEFLELACGSGEITKRLAKKHRITALDLSQTMVDEARSKAEAESDLLPFSFAQGDMRDLSAYGVYDAIGCFCDSFNYLEDEKEVQAFFDEVYAHLKDGSLFFFDSHSMDRLDEFAEDYEEAGEFEDGTQVQWIISAQDRQIYQDFAFYFDGRTVEEHHCQTVFAPEELKTMLEKNFEILSLCGDFDQDELEDVEKYFFVCRAKPHPAKPEA